MNFQFKKVIVSSSCNFSFYYNSPIWYLRQSEESSALLALKQIRPNDMDEINEEFYKLKSFVEEKEPKSSCSSISQIFTKKQYLQPFASLNILFFLMLFSGKFAIEMYAVDIFQQTQVTIDEHLASVILGMICKS